MQVLLLYSMLLPIRSLWPSNFVNGHLAIKYAELILDIHSASYLLNAAGSGALSLHRSGNRLFFTGVVCQQVSCSLHVPYMLQFIEFVSERPQPGELSQPLLARIPHLFRPHLFPESYQIHYQELSHLGHGFLGRKMALRCCLQDDASSFMR